MYRLKRERESVGLIASTRDAKRRNVPVIEQVIRLVVRQIQSEKSSGTQRESPRVQPGSKVLVLSSVVFVIVFAWRASLPTVILVCGVPRADLTFFRLGGEKSEGRASGKVRSGFLFGFVTYAVQKVSVRASGRVRWFSG